MKILCISEHFHPRVGGTVEYVVRTCAALQASGHEVHLLVPGDGKQTESISGYAWEVTALGVGWPPTGDPEREVRYQFGTQASQLALKSAAAGDCDIVHILFGLFVTEVLDTAALRSLGVPSLTTIHNVPPQECGRSWSGDFLLPRMKDLARLQIVGWKNRRRLKQNAYDTLVVPSETAGKLLQAVLQNARIDVIGHGCSAVLLEKVQVGETRAPLSGKPLRLLTVGGWVPHKRQHLIPEVAKRLREWKIDFVWDLVGPPARIPGYHQAIKEAIEVSGLHDVVRAQGAVPFDELARFYEDAHLYVQPSTEEGFCMTALDAAAVGLPVIGSPTGALPEICRLSGGKLVKSEVEALAEAIRDFAQSRSWSDPREIADRVRERFSWQAAATELGDLYHELRSHRKPATKRQ